MIWAQQLPDDAWMQQLLGPYGVLVLLVLMVWSLIKNKPWLVPGHQYRDMLAERDRYREINQRLTDVLMKGTDTTKSAVELAKQTVRDSS